MMRTLLAALGILASASACLAVELKVIDRKPVANGAEVVGLKMKPGGGKVRKVVTHDGRRTAFVPQDPRSTTIRSSFIEWVPTYFFDSFPILERMVMLKRLQRLRGSFVRSKAPDALPPTMTGGRDFVMPSMSDLIKPPEIHSDCAWGVLGNRSLAMRQIQIIIDSSRSTAAALPCFTTEYDKTVVKMSSIYELWKEYYETRFVKPLHGLDDPAFLDVIEWEMASTQK